MKFKNVSTNVKSEELPDTKEDEQQMFWKAWKTTKTRY